MARLYRTPTVILITGFISGVALLMLALCTIRRRRPTHSSSSSLALAMSNAATTPKRILCYGDSLTAGMSPPSIDYFPYAPYLEKELQKHANFEKTVVRHRGMPGWTTSQMLQDADGPTTGLRSAIQAVKNPPLALVIILAGTNDLGFGEEADSIAKSIIALHQMCFDQGVSHTIAIGVPPSGYQSVSKEAATKAEQINLLLQRFCNSTTATQNATKSTTYFPFPFPFRRGDENWSPDTLHFSRLGYKTLGESLAPIVYDILLKF